LPAADVSVTLGFRVDRRNWHGGLAGGMDVVMVGTLSELCFGPHDCAAAGAIAEGALSSRCTVIALGAVVRALI